MKVYKDPNRGSVIIMSQHEASALKSFLKHHVGAYDVKLDSSRAMYDNIAIMKYLLGEMR